MMSNVIKFEISQKKFLKWRAKSPQKVAFRMPFHYFSPFISLLFTNPKVTNCPAIRYFFRRMEDAKENEARKASITSR